jgi:Anthranilate/para-aminobenzoate synthases component I
MTGDDFLSLVQGEKRPVIVPLCLEMPLPSLSPPDFFAGLSPLSGYLLESMEGPLRDARYSFIGLNPELVFSIGKTVHCEGNEELAHLFSNISGHDPVGCIKDILGRLVVKGPPVPGFSGGLAGYCTYELAGALEPALGPLKTGTLPMARFMLSRECIAFDHLAGVLRIICNALVTGASDPCDEYIRCHEKILDLRNRMQAIESGGPRKESPASMVSPERTRSNLNQQEFTGMVERVQEHIRAGDIFQAVVSRRIDCEFDGDPFAIYRSLRRINPSPYMYYFNFGDMQVIGSSPEMLVRVDGRQVTTVPIAGTRPRGETPAEDRELEEALLGDEKERAEHTMLVDLARNDVGRVCRFGSVSVDQFMAVEKFSHVQHIVSTVNGELKESLHPCEAFSSCFPAGTVTGAPKIRAMQIISELEPAGRDIYAGAVGFIGFDLNLEFAIAIRTVVVRDGLASLQVGAGIVADSVAAREFEETEQKAGAMIKALAAAGSEGQ